MKQNLIQKIEQFFLSLSFSILDILICFEQILHFLKENGLSNLLNIGQPHLNNLCLQDSN